MVYKLIIGHWNLGLLTTFKLQSKIRGHSKHLLRDSDVSKEPATQRSKKVKIVFLWWIRAPVSKADREGVELQVVEWRLC